MNRNIKLVKEILSVMYKLSRKDLRIGQMMYIVFDRLKSKGTDPFYVENIGIKRELKKLLEE